MESEVSMKNKDGKFDDTKLVDAICRLKSYLNIIDAYMGQHILSEELMDLGLIIENIAGIVKELEAEYMPN